MYEIRVKLTHGCRYQKIADLFDTKVYSYCSELYDLIIIPRIISDNEKEEIIQYILDKENIEFLTGGVDNSKTYVYFRCMCHTSIPVASNIEHNGGMIEHPVLYEDGWEFYKIICLNLKTQSAVLKYVQSLDRFEILSIKDLGRDGIFKYQFISLFEILENLTVKQIEVISKAFEDGYYEIPRKTKTEELARHFDVSRPATEKSLRKAENEIMSTLLPYLLFHRKINQDPETREGLIQYKTKKVSQTS